MCDLYIHLNLSTLCRMHCIYVTGVKRSMAAIKFVLAERREIEQIVKEEELVAERAKIAGINRAKAAGIDSTSTNEKAAASPK
jgi:hypothetical protein